MKVVLIGRSGQLGWELQHTLPILGEVIGLSRAELDLSDLKNVQKTILELQPDVVINASAFTEVDLAETQIESAMQINAVAPGVLAELSRKLRAIFIHYTTDYVFDGKGHQPYTENDIASPINVYGKSKFLGEENIKQAGELFLIFRTSWVYSLRGNSFVNKVLGWSRKNKTLKIVSDQISNPTWAHILAENTASALVKPGSRLREMIEEKRGIYHLAGGGFTSRYEWAKQILAYDPNRTEQVAETIEPVSSEQFPTPALRPLFTALNCTKFEESFGIHLPNWAESLKVAMTR